MFSRPSDNLVDMGQKKCQRKRKILLVVAVGVVIAVIVPSKALLVLAWVFVVLSIFTCYL